MSQGRIVFIEPKAPGPHIFSAFPLPRLGTILLATMARDHGWEAEVIFEQSQAIDWDALAACDVVGISTITSTAPRAFAIADQVREMGIPVVMGGPHVTFLPEEALDHCDYVVRGEAEPEFPRFLAMILGAVAPEAVAGLSWWQEGAIVHNRDTHGCADLDELPAPDLSLVKGYTGRIAGWTLVPVQTSRGCPFDCSFCSVTGMFGRKYRHRSTESIIAELRKYDHPRSEIFFYDDNFAASPKKTHDLVDAMLDEGFQFRWTAQVRADIVRDRALVEKMAKSGCTTVYIGFESVNPASLKAVKKQQTVEQMRDAARILHDVGIRVHGMFVLGLDDDTPKSVRETVRFARREKMTSAQFMILTPLPGSRAYDELEASQRIRFRDWGLYDAHHVVYQPLHFSQLTLQRAQIWAHRKFYSLNATLRHLLAFDWVAFGIAHYARGLNRQWIRQNRLYMKLLKLLKPRPNARILADYSPNILLNAPVRTPRSS